MNILGISAFYHDSAAALIREGEIVAAAQEERFSRVKNDRNFPSQAIQYCLDEARLAVADIEYVAFYDSPELTFERLLETYLRFAPRGLKFLKSSAPSWLGTNLEATTIIRRALDYNGPIYVNEHHRSHAASAFYPSPFCDAAILTVDGVGEWATGSCGVGRNNQIELLCQTDFPDSLGLLYSALTHFLGFEVNSDEYKVMGLAPYGAPVYVNQILNELVDLKADGSLRLNMDYFTFCTDVMMTGRQMEDLFKIRRRENESPLSQAHMDLAKSVQYVVEEVMLRTSRHLRSLTSMRRLCLAGGVALNCVANGRILSEQIFDELWIQPAAGDAGCAIGAALEVWYGLLQNERLIPMSDSMKGALLGPQFSDESIRTYLSCNNYPFDEIQEESDLVQSTAEFLAAGDVVGWFQGRMEFGPRALGCRSILGDPRSPTMQRVLNRKIKNRESFRPFAPSIQSEHVSDFFDTCTDSPYMMLAVPVAQKRLRQLTQDESRLSGLNKLEAARSDIPAVTHIDCSARLQTVRATDHQLFHNLLGAFAQRTGYPLLVNTSFNVRGQPIVCSPEDAYRCFMSTGMDRLVINHFVLHKDQQPRLASPVVQNCGEAGPKGRFKIVLLGGSTAEGWPFHPQLSIGALARHFLDGKVGDLPIEVVNLGRAGKASRDVVQSLNRIPEDTSLVFLYSGHNEYWARWEFPSGLAAARQTMFAPHIASRRLQKRIHDEYRNNIEEIARYCNREKIPLVISTVARNTCGRPPNRSTLKNVRNESKIRELLKAYCSHRAAHDIYKALATIDEALAIEPCLAIAHRYRAECLHIQGDLIEAQRAYDLSMAYDGFPTAATPDQNDSLKEIAQRFQCRLFDAESILSQASAAGIIDDQLMIDMVHPNLEGYARLGYALAEVIRSMSGNTCPLPGFSLPCFEGAFQLDNKRKVLALTHVAWDLLHSSKMLSNGTELVDRVIERCLKEAVELDPDSPELSFLRFLAESFRGRQSLAEQFLDLALRQGEVRTKALIHPSSLVPSLVMQQYILSTKVGPLLKKYNIRFESGVTSRLPIGYAVWAQRMLCAFCERVAIPLIYLCIIFPLSLTRIRKLRQRTGTDTYWKRYSGSHATLLLGRRSDSGFLRSLKLLVVRKRWSLIIPALVLLLISKAFRSRETERVPTITYTLF